MFIQDLEYTFAGKTFTGYLARPEGLTERRPGILVCHAAGGLRDHEKERARMLADRGYVAFAMDTFGELTTGSEHSRAMMAALSGDLPTLRGRVNAALEKLKSHPDVDASRTAAIGFCFGGSTVLELARSGAEVACVVGFHATLRTTAPEDAKNVRCKVMVCLGADDPVVPADQRAAFMDEMTKGGVDWQMILYSGTVHAFTDKSVDKFGNPAAVYNASSDRRSWRAMIDLFNETMQPAW